MLLRQTLIYLPAQLIGPLAQFVSIIIWTHYLSPAELGVFALLVAAQELVYTTALFWFSIYTIRYFDITASASARSAFLATELSVMTAASVVTAVLTAIVTVKFATDWSWTLFGWAVIYAITRTIAAHLAERARSVADMMSYSILQIVWPVAGLVLGTIFVHAFGGTATNVLAGYTLAQAVALIWAVRRMGIGAHFQWSKEIIDRALRYGLPLVVGAQLLWLANNGIRFLVEYWEGAAAVGLITIGWTLGLRIASMVALMVMAAAFPLAVARTRDHGDAAGQQQLVQNGLLLLAILAPATVGFLMISEPMTRLLIAAEYQAMTIAILPWAVLAGAARNLRVHFGEQIFLLREQPMVPLFNDIVDCVAVTAGAFAGYYGYGLLGGVIGASVGSVLALVVTALFGYVRHRFFLPVADVARVSAAVAAMGAVLYYNPIMPTVLSVAAAIIIGAGVYSLALALLYPSLAGEMIGRLKRLNSG